ncbi:MAG: cyclase family protein [Thermomicrobiales bacterium]
MFDLTQRLTPNIPRFPGDPEVRIEPLPDMEPWQVSRLALGTHSGTHMDAPKHRIAGGAGIDAYDPERFLGAGLVIDATGFPDNSAIPASVLDAIRTRVWPGWFAVIRTGWDQYWGDPRYFTHPWLSPELATALVTLAAGLVAIDALSVDSTVDAGSEAHEILLGADRLIAENLRGLERLTAPSPFMFAFLPLALAGADGSPARVVAWRPGEIATP